MKKAKAPVEHKCYTCIYWIPDYGSCYYGKSEFCSQYTKPTDTCNCWAEKKYKARMFSYIRRTKEEIERDK